MSLAIETKEIVLLAEEDDNEELKDSEESEEDQSDSKEDNLDKDVIEE